MLQARSLLAGLTLGAGIAIAAFAFAPAGHRDDAGPATAVGRAAAPHDDRAASAQGDAGTSLVTEHAGPGRSYRIAGASYALSSNASGAVLTSAKGSRIFLGRDCDAWSDEFGKGRWEWANAGFAIVLGGREFAFPRMDPPVEADACRM